MTLQSNLLHTLSGGNLLVLSECRRSDQNLYNFYSSLIEGGSRFEALLEDVIREAARTFQRQHDIYRYNLVISHRRRRAINEAMSDKLAPEGSTAIELEGSLVKVWPGLQLVCSATLPEKGLYNGCPYTIVEITDDAVAFKELEKPLCIKKVQEAMRLSFASTYAGCQGTEFTGTLCLRDVQHRFFTRKHLFVGLSRAKVAADVAIGK